MINFKGVTPPQNPIKEPPSEPDRISIQDTTSKVDAPQMKKQLEQDTVSFGSSPYQQSKSAISAASKLAEIKRNPMAVAAMKDLKLLAQQEPHNKSYQREVQATLRNLHEQYKLSK